MNLLTIKSVFFTIFCAVSALLLLSCAEPSDAQDSDPGASSVVQNAVVVTALRLEPGLGYHAQSLYTGMVEAARSGELAFEVGGTVVAVNIDEGDQLTRGQTIAVLNQDRLRAHSDEAKAGLVQAQAAVALAESTLSRLEEARSFDGVSAQQYDEASNAALSARAAVLGAEARLNSASVDLAKTNLQSVYPSVVIKRFVDEGQVVAPGQPIVRVQDAGPPEVRIGVAGDQVGELLPGQVMELRVNDQLMTATIKSIGASRDQVTRTIDVVLVFAPQTESDATSASDDKELIPANEAIEYATLRPGDLARLALTRHVEAAGFWLPLSAITEGERGLWNAYVLARQTNPRHGATHEVTSRVVELLYQDGQLAFVNGALNAGDQIVASGLNRIVPGQFVRIGATTEITPP